MSAQVAEVTMPAYTEVWDAVRTIPEETMKRRVLLWVKDKDRTVTDLEEKCEQHEKKIANLAYANEIFAKEKSMRELELAQCKEQLAVANQIVDELSMPEKILCSPGPEKDRTLGSEDMFLKFEVENLKRQLNVLQKEYEKEMAECDSRLTQLKISFAEKEALISKVEGLSDDLSFASNELTKLLDEKEERLNREQADLEEETSDLSDEDDSDSDESDEEEDDDDDSDESDESDEDEDSGEDSDSSTDSDDDEDKKQYMHDLEYALKSKYNKVEELEEKLAQLEKELCSERRRKEEVEVRTNFGSIKISKLEFDLNESQCKIKVLKNTLANNEAACAALKKEVAEQRKVNIYQNQVTANIESILVGERSEKQILMMQLSEQRKYLSVVMKEFKESSHKYESTIEALKETQEVMSGELKSVKQKLTKMGEEKLATETNTSATISSLNTTIVRLEQEYKVLRSENEQLENEHDKTKQELQHVVEQRNQINRHLEQADNCNEGLREQVAELSYKLENMGVEEIDTDDSDVEDEPEEFEEVRAASE